MKRQFHLTVKRRSSVRVKNSPPPDQLYSHTFILGSFEALFVIYKNQKAVPLSSKRGRTTISSCCSFLPIAKLIPHSAFRIPHFQSCFFFIYLTSTTIDAPSKAKTTTVIINLTGIMSYILSPRRVMRIIRGITPKNDIKIYLKYPILLAPKKRLTKSIGKTGKSLAT